MSEYTKASIALLKAKARRLVRDDRARVVHIHPRAYCVAKPALYCAVFAVPTCDREPQVADDAWDVVSNKSCADVKMGDWCSLAYISTRVSGECHVLQILQPKSRCPMTEAGVLVAWAVEINDMTAIVFAPTAPKARYKAVRGYWEAFGQRKGEWPRAVAWREPRFDNSSLKQRDPSRCYCREFVEGT